MGLDFTYEGEARDVGEAPRWSYSGFMRFRERLAAEAGLGELRRFEGFGGAREWPQVFDESLVLLLNHSDCEGELSPESCALIAPRLREVIERWPEDDYDRQSGERLATYMEACAAHSTPLIFT